MSAFSKRHRNSDHIYVDIEDHVRSRLFELLKAELNRRFGHFLDEVGSELMKLYGYLSAPSYRALSVSDHPVVEHFFDCEGSQFLDFLEIGLASRTYREGRLIEDLNRPVSEINEVFRQEDIPYRVTPFIDKREPLPPIEYDEDGQAKRPKMSPPAYPSGGIPCEFPQIIPRSDGYLQDEAVEPCLSVLANPVFVVAEREFREAIEHYRAGRFDDAITNCGSAFESVLKTVCYEKKWGFDPNRDTCSKLVDICKSHDLFPSFYDGAMKATCTIRNRLASAHGRGPDPQHEPSEVNIEHLFHVVAANILFVIRSAGLGPLK